MFNSIELECLCSVCDCSRQVKNSAFAQCMMCNIGVHNVLTMEVLNYVDTDLGRNSYDRVRAYFMDSSMPPTRGEFCDFFWYHLTREEQISYLYDNSIREWGLSAGFAA